MEILFDLIIEINLSACVKFYIDAEGHVQFHLCRCLIMYNCINVYYTNLLLYELILSSPDRNPPPIRHNFHSKYVCKSHNAGLKYLQVARSCPKME